MVRVGLISDTHGRLDRRAAAALDGVDAIVHAGDVCAEQVLMELEAIAPVTAVAGNCDSPMVIPHLREREITTIAGVTILVIHDFNDLGEIPDGVDVVVAGHSHRPREEWHGQVLVVNPGSASQRRSQPWRSVAILEIESGEPKFTLVPLAD